METVNSVVNAASKAIWGEQDASKTTNETGDSEPVSGLQGKGTATEPFDQGNADVGEQHVAAATLGNETGGKEPVSGLQGEGSLSEPFDKGNEANPTDTTSKSNISEPLLVTKSETTTHEPTTFKPFEPEKSSHTETGAPSTSEIPILPSKALPSGDSKPEEKTAEAGVSAPAQNYTFVDGELVPASSVNKSESLGDSHKGAGLSTSDAPVDVGNRAFTTKKDHGDELLQTRDHAGHSSEANKPGTHQFGDEPKGVKPAGLHSEGGDLTATKPSAGKEADRIVEDKGDRQETSTKVEPPSAAPASGEKEKVSKLDKIKDKLHIGHKDK